MSCILRIKRWVPFKRLLTGGQRTAKTMNRSSSELIPPFTLWLCELVLCEWIVQCILLSVLQVYSHTAFLSYFLSSYLCASTLLLVVQWEKETCIDLTVFVTFLRSCCCFGYVKVNVYQLIMCVLAALFSNWCKAAVNFRFWKNSVTLKLIMVKNNVLWSPRVSEYRRRDKTV